MLSQTGQMDQTFFMLVQKSSAMIEIGNNNTENNINGINMVAALLLQDTTSTVTRGT